MKKLFFLFILYYISLNQPLLGQDTFSIVAVDPSTGEVGSAGATCLDDDAIAGGAVIISKLIPGKGAVNTQSYWDPTNQMNATNQVKLDKSSGEVISWLEANDISNNPSIRQYGVAVLDSKGQANATGYTGINCLDVKLHRSGTNYSTQGNILISEDIIKGMEINFLNTNGSLADKLMAALQAANIPGADSRCLSEGVSSKSAFIRVARPNDTEGNYYLDIVVSKTDFGAEPIDSVQKYFDDWSLINETADEAITDELSIYPNPISDTFTLKFLKYNPKNNYELEIRDPSGKMIQIEKISEKTSTFNLKKSKIQTGQFIYTFKENGLSLKQGVFLVVEQD